MAKGPGIQNYDEKCLKYRSEDCDTSFRLIQYYEIRSDEKMLRFDIKRGANQYSTCFVCADPIKPIPGASIKATDDLITPANGIIDCLNIKAPKAAIIEVLTELLQDLKDEP